MNLQQHKHTYSGWGSRLINIAMLLVLIVGFVNPQGTLAQAPLPLVTNGDFSDGLDGWSSSGSVTHNTTYFWVAFNYQVSPVDGVLWQQISTDPGQLYTLRYDVIRLGTNEAAIPQALVEVVDAGTNSVLASTVSAGSSTNRELVHYTLRFTAQGASIIRFTDTTTDTYRLDLGLDNVAVVEEVMNSAPVAVDDSYSAAYGMDLTIDAPGVLGNDTDLDGNPLTAALVSGPANGALSFNSDGSFIYTGNPDFVGQDAFTYTANDGAADSNVATVTISVQPPENAAGLLGYWKFDEGSGSTAADSAGNIPALHGTLSSTGAAFSSSAAPVTAFADPGSLSVSGGTGVVSVPNSAINKLTNNFTVMGWINPASVSGYQRVIASAKTKSSNGWSFGLLSNRILFTTIGKADYSSPVTGMSAGKWVHIAATMGADNLISFYVDGVLVGTATAAAPATADLDDGLQIGATTASGGSAPTEPFTGLIDDLRVYDHALTAAEIASLVGVDHCSETVLRARVMLGEASASKIITLENGCTYTLTSVGDTASDGSGIKISYATTIEGNGAVIERSASAPQFRLLNVGPAITINNLTLRGGYVASEFGGAGIYASSHLTLNNTRFENNSAVNKPGSAAAPGGGAIKGWGNLTVDRSTFIDNQTGGYGGAINFAGTTGRITNSVFANNQSGIAGAAVRASSASGSLTLINNTFTDAYPNPKEAVLANGVATFQNNIFDNFFTAATVSGATSFLTEDYNLFANSTEAPLAVSGATITSGGHDRLAATPRFEDPASDNYHLQQNSPAIDMGTVAALTVDADGKPRPATSGTPVDIGAYEYQGVGVPSVGITKAGPPYVSVGAQFQFTLTVFNEGTSPITDLQILDPLPVGATLVAGSVTDGGALNGSTLTWNLAPLGPNQTKRVTYKVTATQDLLSSGYSVSSISTPAIAASGPDFTTPYNASAWAGGFFPYPDGFNFPNGGWSSLDSYISVEDMVAIYGPGVCKTQNPCVLSAAAEAVRQTKLKAGFGGGHCAGMAAASEKIYLDPNFNPDTMQPGTLLTYDVAAENARKEIQLYMSTQGDIAANTSGLPTVKDIPGARAIVDALKANYSNPNAADHYLLSLFDINGGSGHRVTPYAVVQQSDPDQYWIYVYDNNYPNNFNRVFKVTYSTGAWVYEGGATSPSAPPSIYQDDGTQPGHLVLRSFAWLDAFPKKCTDACAPGPFVKSGPANGATGVSTSPTLAWAASEGANAYDVCYDTTNDNTCSGWVTVKTNSRTLTGLAANTTYYWQVRAYNGGYAYANGAAAAYWSFTTGAATAAAQSFAMTQAMASTQADGDPAPALEAATFDFQLEGEGSLMITRSDGKRAGVDPATRQFIAEIPGAEQILNEGGLGMNIPGVIRITHEPGMTYTLRVAATQNTYGNTSATADLNIFGGAYVTRLEDLKLDSPADIEGATGETDVVGVTFDPDNHNVGFTSSTLDSDTPTLAVAISQNGAPDFAFEISGAEMSSGSTLSTAIDPTTGTVTVENDNPGSDTYNIEVERVNLDGSTTSFAGTASDGTGAGTDIDLGSDWTGGEPPIRQNNAPVAQDQPVSTNQDTPVAITLAATDADSDPLTYSIVAQPQHGALSGTGANLTYTPNAGYTGPDSFTFTANDGADGTGADSNIATVNLTVVLVVNTAPTAASDAYTTLANTALTVTAPGVLKNDTDADGDALASVMVSNPAHGTLAVNPDGSFTYTPASNFVGTDSFTYKANDGAADSNVATVTIKVTYKFTGFFQPVDNLPIENTVKAGQSIPVKFSLGGNLGLNIFGPGSPSSRQVTCPGSSVPVDAIETTTTSNSGLTYNPASGQYTYVWKTEKGWANTCRLFTVTFADGSTQQALFQFKK